MITAGGREKGLLTTYYTPTKTNVRLQLWSCTKVDILSWNEKRKQIAICINKQPRFTEITWQFSIFMPRIWYCSYIWWKRDSISIIMWGRFIEKCKKISKWSFNLPRKAKTTQILPLQRICLALMKWCNAHQSWKNLLHVIFLSHLNQINHHGSVWPK